MNRFLEAVKARCMRSSHNRQMTAALMKTLENIAYERAGHAPPHDDIEIFSQITAIKTEMRQCASALSDEAALVATELFEEWNGSSDYKQGDRITENGILYVALQNIAANPTWKPSSVPSLWKPVAKPTESGTFESPITAVAGMEYEAGKYYAEGDKIYLCIRSELLHFLPSALVGQYFEEVAS
ncbi:MAG: hypothetical protein IJ264_04665 [Clostridia bacterium]|nr:hypothetical protein [Clostridia bacterium]